MARNPLPRSNFGAASLVERRNDIPPVDLEAGPDAEVLLDDDNIIETPDLSTELEDDGGVVVDFEPLVGPLEGGDFYDNLGEELDDNVATRIASELLDQYEAN